MAAGDYSSDRVSVSFGEVTMTAELYRGSTVVKQVLLPYGIVFPSGEVWLKQRIITPGPAVQAAVAAGAEEAAADVLKFEGLSLIWTPAPPAPLE